MTAHRWIGVALTLAMMPGSLRASPGGADQGPDHGFPARCVILDEASLRRMLREDRCIRVSQLAFVIEADEMDGDRLVGVTMKWRDGRGGYDQFLKAEEAKLSFDRSGRRLLLHVRCARLWNATVRAWFVDRVFETPLW